MNLFLDKIVSEKHDERSNKDRRFKIIRIIASYQDEQGIEYRKSFEAKGVPHVPSMGTHESLNALKIQY